MSRMNESCLTPPTNNPFIHSTKCTRTRTLSYADKWAIDHGRCGSYEWVMSHMNDSCPIWMSHVPYEWVMSHVNEACLILTMNEAWMRHVPYEWGMSHMNEACPIWMRHVPYEWGMSHMNEACLLWLCLAHTDESLTREDAGRMIESCPKWMGRVSYMSHVPYEWGLSHIDYERGMSQMNEACLIWLRQSPTNKPLTMEEVGLMNESCPIWISHVPYEWVMSHMNEASLILTIEEVGLMNESCPFIKWNALEMLLITCSHLRLVAN